MAEQKEKTILDLDAMMDGNLDAVPDMPDFINPPDGNYILKSEAKIDKRTPKPTTEEPNPKPISQIKMTTTVVKTLELGNKNELPVPDGTLFSENFQATEEGLGYFKARAIKILNVEDVKGVSLKDIMAELSGKEYTAKVTLKKTAKNDGSGGFYENVQVRVIPPTKA